MNALGKLAVALCLLAPLTAVAEAPPTPLPGPTPSAQQRQREAQREERREERREAKRHARREAMFERRHPPPPGPPGHRIGPGPGRPGPGPSAQALAEERRRLEAEVALLRQRLEEAGYSEAGRERPTWWDLPSRRSQAMRLRLLRRLRHELDWRLDRLEDLREQEEPHLRREKD